VETLQLVLVGLLSIALMGGTVAFALWLSRRGREDHNARARLINAAFSAVAARRGDTVVPGEPYEHPMMGEFQGIDRVRGVRGALTFRMNYTQGGSDSPDVFTISVSPIGAPTGRLKKNTRDLSPESRALVDEFADLGHVIHVEPETRGNNMLVVTLDEARPDALEPETLASLVERTVALAKALEQS
jgi:hypothetical protein